MNIEKSVPRHSHLGGVALLGMLFIYTLTGGTGTAQCGEFAVIHSFVDSVDDGRIAWSQQVVKVGSRLYGVTRGGGAYDQGVIFGVNLDGSDFTLLHEFQGGVVDGKRPDAGLVSDGTRLYGSTRDGYVSAHGLLFSINVDGSDYTILHGFGVIEEGYPPLNKSLILNGTTLYGVTLSGGVFNRGGVFSIETDGSGYTIIYNLPYENSAAMSISLGGSTFFLTTTYGIYSVELDGSGYTTLHEFIDEEMPEGAPFRDGQMLYGMTARGGIDPDSGLFYSMGVDGSDFTILHDFMNLDGRTPRGNLLKVGSTFYGTTHNGGSAMDGVLFSMKTDGSDYTVLHEFDEADINNGANPVSVPGFRTLGSLRIPLPCP